MYMNKIALLKLLDGKMDQQANKRKSKLFYKSKLMNEK